MKIQITGKHLALTKGLKVHVEDKLEKLERYSDRLVGVQVLLKMEKRSYYAEITASGKDLKVFSKAQSTENFFAAFDAAEAKIISQLRKRKEKLKKHLSSPRKEAKEKMLADLAEPEALELQGRIIKHRGGTLISMHPDEAHELMSQSDKPVLVFEHAEKTGLHIMYRREDGNFGLIEPR